MEKHKRDSWDDYHFGIMNAVAKRATCDRGRSGALIVRDNRILVTGYVGSPPGFPHCDEVGHELEQRTRNGKTTEHCIRTIHAELNAILQAAKYGIPIAGAIMYSRMTPCPTICVPAIIMCGIIEIKCEKRYQMAKESEVLLKMAGISISYKYNKEQEYDDRSEK